MAAIVSALQTAAPRAEIVVLGLYNAYPTVLPGGDMLTKALNTTLRSVVTGLGADFADPLPVFNPASVTGGSEIARHPDDLPLHQHVPGWDLQPGQPVRGHPSDRHRVRDPRRDRGGGHTVRSLALTP